MSIIIYINIITITKNKGIHKGDNTHSHDQLITWVNFNIINKINNKPLILVI